MRLSQMETHVNTEGWKQIEPSLGKCEYLLPSSEMSKGAKEAVLLVMSGKNNQKQQSGEPRRAPVS